MPKGYDLTMGRRYFRPRAVLLWLLPVWALLATAACDRGTSSDVEPYFFDLLVDQAWVGGPSEPEELPTTYCLDATRKGIELNPGRSVLTDLGQVGFGGSREFKLVIEACSAAHHQTSSVEISWSEDAQGPPIDHQILEIPALRSARQEISLPAQGSYLRIAVPPSSSSSVNLQEVAIDGWKSQSVSAESSARSERAKQHVRSGERPVQILFISVDTLREDGIAALGGVAETPNLDALVAESQTWSPHYSAATWTQPSHATLLTGQYPPLHGVQNPRDMIHPGVTTLAERMRAGGLLTAARVYDCVWLDPKFGFDRGFDDYGVRPYGVGKMVREVSNWMVDHRDQPFFFFFHNFEPHSDFSQLPYEAPGITKFDVQERYGFESFGCREGLCSSGLLQKLETGEMEPLEGELEVLDELYRQGIGYTDLQLGKLFARLKALGMWDRMMIVLTSDHGEAFEAAGRVMHGGTWEEVLRVPLVIKWPAGESAGERRNLPTSSIDLAPTLLSAAGFEADGLPGVDLRIKRRATPIFAGTVERVVLSEGWKGVFRPQSPIRLFHLEEDPKELNNLAESHPLDRERLHDLLRRWTESLKPRLEARNRRASFKSSGEDLTQEEIQRLKSLGYLSDE